MPVAATAQTLPAAGSGPDLWVAQTTADGSGQIIFHRRRDDEPNTLRQATRLDGPLAPGGLAAGRDTLWIIHESLAVYSIRVVPDPARPLLRYTEPAVEKSLPSGVTLRACAADQRRLWVLVGVGDAQVREQLDAPDAGDPRPDEAEPPAAQEAAPAPTTQTTTSNVRVQDRLIRLHGNRWVTVDLPPQWSHEAPCWMVMDGKSPRLVSMDATSLDQFRLGEQGWTHARYRLDGAHGVQPILVESQLIIGRLVSQSQAVTVSLHLLRDDRVIDLGDLSVPNATGAWVLVPVAREAALLVAGAQSELPTWTRMDLRGNVLLEPTPLSIGIAPLWIKATDFVLWVATLAVATLIMFLFWRRDPEANKLDLPPKLALCDFGRRLAAGMLDLAPCVAVAVWLFGITLEQLYEQWPGHAGGWRRMIPGGVVIGLYVAHCALSEMFTARSLGKAVFGLHVTDLRGKAPNVWKILVRNGMKAFDLIAPPLLILPLAGPYRQRLGDLVGRTVVVMRDEQDTKTGADEPPRDGDEEKSDEWR